MVQLVAKLLIVFRLVYSRISGAIHDYIYPVVLHKPGHTPYTEEAATCPNSVYGFTKLAGEQAVMKYCSRAMIIRTAMDSQREIIPRAHSLVAEMIDTGNNPPVDSRKNGACQIIGVFLLPLL